MLDGGRAHITDLRHQNQDETDVIMTQIREMTAEGHWAGTR